MDNNKFLKNNDSKYNKILIIKNDALIYTTTTTQQFIEQIRIKNNTKVADYDNALAQLRHLTGLTGLAATTIIDIIEQLQATRDKIVSYMVELENAIKSDYWTQAQKFDHLIKIAQVIGLFDNSSYSGNQYIGTILNNNNNEYIEHIFFANNTILVANEYMHIAVVSIDEFDRLRNISDCKYNDDHIQHIVISKSVSYTPESITLINNDLQTLTFNKSGNPGKFSLGTINSIQEIKYNDNVLTNICEPGELQYLTTQDILKLIKERSHC
jgi:hypothetical protein